ncbi:hypothetical protein SFRURICE_001180 [Spodoptera frugiperda]|nr:hypothetical protein SFRURICE_001180 [Spodoptera frugiperda]
MALNAWEVIQPTLILFSTDSWSVPLSYFKQFVVIIITPEQRFLVPSVIKIKSENHVRWQQEFSRVNNLIRIDLTLVFSNYLPSDVDISKNKIKITGSNALKIGLRESPSPELGVNCNYSVTHGVKRLLLTNKQGFIRKFEDRA